MKKAKAFAKETAGGLSDKARVLSAKTGLGQGDCQDLEIAVVKATKREEVLPKEKHVQTLQRQFGPGANRQRAAFVVEALVKRLKSQKDWLVVQKVLVTVHRLMREADATFMDEVLAFADRTGLHSMFILESFVDSTRKPCFDYSAWIRPYSTYLDERLHSWRECRYDAEREQGAGQGSRFENATVQKLLKELPPLQKLMRAVTACVPSGAATEHPIIQFSILFVLREAVRVYQTVYSGLMQLVNIFFDLDAADASNALSIYRESLDCNTALSAYFQKIQNLGSSFQNTMHFPTLENPPPDFLKQMEDYVRLMNESEGGSKATAIRKPVAVSGGPIGAGTGIIKGSASRRLDQRIVQEFAAVGAQMQKLQEKAQEAAEAVVEEEVKEAPASSPVNLLGSFDDLDLLGGADLQPDAAAAATVAAPPQEQSAADWLEAAIMSGGGAAAPAAVPTPASQVNGGAEEAPMMPAGFGSLAPSPAPAPSAPPPAAFPSTSPHQASPPQQQAAGMPAPVGAAAAVAATPAPFMPAAPAPPQAPYAAFPAGAGGPDPVMVAPPFGAAGGQPSGSGFAPGPSGQQTQQSFGLSAPHNKDTAEVRKLTGRVLEELSMDALGMGSSVALKKKEGTREFKPLKSMASHASSQPQATPPAPSQPNGMPPAASAGDPFSSIAAAAAPMPFSLGQQPPPPAAQQQQQQQQQQPFGL